MTKETIADKITKLLAKAQDTATTPQESALFLAKAQELMIAHQIEASDLDTDTDEPSIEENQLNEEDKGKSSCATWKSALAVILGKYNGCFIHRNGPKIILTGKQENTQVVRALYRYCVYEINRLAKELASGQGRTYINNFRFGAIKAIEEAIQRERENQKRYHENNERALVSIDKVLVDAKMARNFAHNRLSLRSSSSKFRRDDNGKAAGYNAGSSIYGGFGTNRIGYK